MMDVQFLEDPVWEQEVYKLMELLDKKDFRLKPQKDKKKKWND